MKEGISLPTNVPCIKSEGPLPYFRNVKENSDRNINGEVSLRFAGGFARGAPFAAS